MKKSAEILGLPIISITEGRELGVSKTLLIDAKNGQVAAITIEDEDWYRGVKLIPYESVIAIGEDAVTITHSENILNLEEAGDYERLLIENIRVIGTKAITKKGRIQGTVSEVFIGDGGKIEQCEITAPDGSTSEVSAAQIAIFGKQVTVVDVDGEKKNNFVTEPPAFEPAFEPANEEPAQEVWTPAIEERPAEVVEAAEILDTPADTVEAAEILDTSADTVEAAEILDTSADTVEAAEILDTPADTVEATEILDTPADTVEAAEILDTPADTVEAAEILDTPADTVEAAEILETPADTVEAAEILETPAEVVEATETPAEPSESGVEEQFAAEVKLSEEEQKIATMTKQAKGLKEALLKARDNAQAAQESAPMISQKKQVEKAVVERRRRALVGKHATKTITAESGTVVVEAGAEITEEVLQRARLSNKFIELSMNVQ